MATPFIFKQFTINHDRCAMKIGTDGVLLGAWTSIKHKPDTILDIGAGTGIIALMLAQRSIAETIDAIEIDEDAYEQCVDNFEASIWADRLYCYHAGLDEFVDEIDDTYDLIVSNPPFYSEDVESGNTARDVARQNQSLPFDELLKSAAKLLSENGIFATIIPYKEEENFIELAETFKLYPKRILHMRGTTKSELKRSLLEFSFTKTTCTTTELIIEKERHQYTDDYIALTRAFYLKM